MPENTPETQVPRPSKSKGAVGPRSIRGRLAAGILIVIPLAVTAILIRYVYTVALMIGVKIVNWAHLGYLWATDVVEAVPPLVNPADPGWEGITLAVGMTIGLLYLLGWLGSNVVGRRAIEMVETLFQRIPFVDTVYGAMKRMVQALSGVGKDGDKPQRVVLVDFPHENMKAIAFMTNTLTDLNSGQKLATVYVPTTPNPTSGYMEIVPINRITQTDWTMEQALSMILSGGATAPQSVRLEPRPADE